MLCTFEGLRLFAYRCPAGEPTIGYGHKLTEEELLSGVYSRGITKERAEELLDQDIAIAARTIASVVKVSLNANQRDALICLVFNAGGGVLLGTAPKMTAALKVGDWATAAHEMLDIDKRRDPGTGALVVDAGLHARRQVEAALFLSSTDDIDHDAVMSAVGVSLCQITADLEASWIHSTTDA